MTEKIPFLTMYELWGTDIAIEKCKEFNIAVSPLDLLKARDMEKQKRERLSAIIAQIKGKPPVEVTEDAAEWI